MGLGSAQVLVLDSADPGAFAVRGSPFSVRGALSSWRSQDICGICGPEFGVWGSPRATIDLPNFVSLLNFVCSVPLW